MAERDPKEKRWGYQEGMVIIATVDIPRSSGTQGRVLTQTEDEHVLSVLPCEID